MNYYLAKSNPNTFRLEDILRTHPLTSLWRVCRDAKVGDILFIGLSGHNAGILAKAIITSPARHTPASTTNLPYYINPEEAKSKWRADVTFCENRIDRPIVESDLASSPLLGRVARWLHIQGGVCRLTPEEAETLDGLIRSR